MKTINRLAVIIALLIRALPGHAAAGWSGFGPISELNQNPGVGPGNDSIFFYLSSGGTNPAGCSVGNGFFLNIVNDRHRRIFAMLMAAQASGRNVQVYVTGNCHSPWGFAEIDGVTIQ